MNRFALREIDAPLPGHALPGLFGGRIAVLDDATGIATPLVAALRARGVQAEPLGALTGDVQALIDLRGLEPVRGDDPSPVLREAFLAARSLARAPGGPRLLVLAQDTGGGFGLDGRDPQRAPLGGLAGLAKTAAQEWPEAGVKLIDLERGGRSLEALAEALARELLHGGSEVEVGLRTAGRRTRLASAFTPVDELPLRTPVDEHAVFVVSGGARGVTAAAVSALARVSRARFVLLGRSELTPEPSGCAGIHDEGELRRRLIEQARAEGRPVAPAEVAACARGILASREIRSTLAELEAAGSAARYAAVDVRDAAALTALLDDTRRQWGPITGLVHGAGVLADKRIADKTPEQFDQVLETKVAGLRSLLAATANDPLKHIAFFSSIAARCGNVGQCDYAMANEVLNKLAAVEAARRGPDCRVSSFNWGPWEAGMVTPALKAHFEARGVPLLPIVEGAAMFVDELQRAPAGQIEVVFGPDPSQGAWGVQDEAANAPRSVRREIAVDAKSHGWLIDHRVREEPVLPMALALDWLARAARAACPGQVPTVCRDLRVLRGLVLDQLATGHVLSAQAVPSTEEGQLIVEATLQDQGATRGLRYACRFEMAPADAQPPAPRWPHAADTPTWPCTVGEAYGMHLFHGPAFQVIRTLDRYDTQGGSATLATAAEAAWSGGPWSVDPALMDGGLQIGRAHV